MLSQYNIKGMTSEDGGSTPLFDNSLLLANARGVWSVYASYAPLAIKSHHIAAHGSGSEYALGAAHSMRSHSCAITRVKACLDASLYYDVNSGGKPWLDVLTKEAPRQRSKLVTFNKNPTKPLALGK